MTRKMCNCNQGRLPCECRAVIGEVIAEDVARRDRRTVVLAGDDRTLSPLALLYSINAELRQQLADVSNERDEAVSRRDMIHKQLSAWQRLASERLDMFNASEARSAELEAALKLLAAECLASGFNEHWESFSDAEKLPAQPALDTDEGARAVRSDKDQKAIEACMEAGFLGSKL